MPLTPNSRPIRDDGNQMRAVRAAVSSGVQWLAAAPGEYASAKQSRNGCGMDGSLPGVG